MCSMCIRIILFVLCCMPILCSALVQCTPPGTCQCRRFRVPAITFPNYNFLITNPVTTNVNASIECRSRNAGGQSQISFEISMAGDISGRTMSNGSNAITFNVFHPGSTTVVLGENANAYTYTGTVGDTYTVIPLSLPAEVFTGQNVPDGQYQGFYVLTATHPQNNNVRTRARNRRFRVNVERVCQVSATDINLGTYFATTTSPTTRPGTITIQCTPNIMGSISANPGTGSSSYTNRVLSSGSNTINYNLYTNAGLTTIFGDGTGGSQSISGTTTGGTQITNYYASIPPGQFDPVGTYSSNVVLTLNI